MTRRRGRPKFLVALVAVAVIVVGIVVARDSGRRASLGSGHLVFVDEFDGAAGNPPSDSWGEWSGCTYNASAYYGDIKCGTRAALDGAGHLLVKASPGVGTSISTAGRFSFVYGEVSAWIKLPREVGYWPAFWTLNANPDGSASPANGEIDVLESYTTFPGVYHRGVHNWNSEQLTWGSPTDLLCGNTDLSSSFHKYSVRVEPDRITFLFDDVPCGAVVTSADGDGKPYQFGPANRAGNWLLLTLAVGGAGGQQKPATDPASMVVDRVEVRSL